MLYLSLYIQAKNITNPQNHYYYYILDYSIHYVLKVSGMLYLCISIKCKKRKREKRKRLREYVFKNCI